jgi:hypothetical protein
LADVLQRTFNDFKSLKKRLSEVRQLRQQPMQQDMQTCQEECSDESLSDASESSSVVHNKLHGLLDQQQQQQARQQQHALGRGPRNGIGRYLVIDTAAAAAAAGTTKERTEGSKACFHQEEIRLVTKAGAELSAPSSSSGEAFTHGFMLAPKLGLKVYR